MNGNYSEEEHALHQAEHYQQKLEKALAALGMRYWEYDIRTKRLYRSILIQNEVGYSAYKENVPESYVEEGIIHPAYAGAYLDFYHNLAKGIEGRLVFQSKYADGHWGWLDISYTIHRDKDGNPIKAVGIGGDISRYSSVTIFQMREQCFSVLYANEVFFQMYDCEKEQYRTDLSGYLNKTLDAETKTRAAALIQRAIQTGELQTMEYPFHRPDGKTLWLSRKFLVVPRQEADTFLVPAITEDITERHAAEEKLAGERNMYQSLLDESSAMITVVDAENYEIVYANRATLEVTKHLEGGYVGNICYRCVQNANKPCPACLLVRQGAPDVETKDVDYGGRSYRMTYKKITWNGKAALLERSEDITEQKQNLMLLEQSRKQQEQVIDNLPTGIIVFKIDHGAYQIVQVNPAICRMMQMDAQKAVGTSGNAILQLTHPEDKHILIEAAQKLAVPGTELHYEFRSLNRKTGLYTWTSADGKSALQSDGSILVYIGYQDITDRREKEEEYKRRIDLLAELDDENLIAKGRHNLTQNKVIAYSPKAGSAAPVKTDRSYDDAVAALAQMAMTPEKTEELKRETDRELLIEKYRSGQAEGSVEFRRNLPHQSPRWTVIKYSLFEEPESHDVIAFMYSYDITERVRENSIIAKIGGMEYDLMGLIDVNTRQYTLINQFATTPSDVLTANGDFDAAIKRRLKYSQEQGENPTLIQDFLLDKVLIQLQKKEIYSILYSVFAPEQRPRRKRVQYSYLDETKETIMFFRSDITEMYEKEQEQLREIQRALETATNANAAKTEFFSRMSHDMRTPMNGILGLAILSRDENDPAVLRENIGKIYESGQYLLGLINDTLDFQRIESGRLKLEPQIVSTTEIVNNIIDMVRRAAEAKGVRLIAKNSNADLDWHVRIDPMRMKQIIINLLSNAVKFTPAGGTVELGFQLLSREGMISHDLITVRDTGIGMSPDFLKNGIFKPFSQESNAVTGQYAGSGLGLSIAKRLVELMGGHIEVESELGVGTTFFVYIDFERVNKDEVRSAVQSSLARSNSVHKNLVGRKLLLVEDHPLNAEIATRLLKKEGCEVDWLQNGAEAVRRFEEEPGRPYDLVLMDIRMPVMDGLEAAKRIRALPSDYAKTVPIIAMTANAYEEDIRRSLEVGMNAHLSKPIEKEIFFDTILKYILRGEPHTGQQR